MRVATQAMLAIILNGKHSKILVFVNGYSLAMLATKVFNEFQGKDWIGMDKQQKDYGYVTNYKIGSTIYEVETSFAGTETLNNKIIRLMLSEKVLSKKADNSNKARYNSNIHSVLSDKEREEFNNE